MTRFLASVRDEREAALALAGGADIVDFKDPANGALGAAAPEAIARGLAQLAGRVLTSATTGDCPLEPRILTEAARRTGAAGVDYVKVGLAPGPRLAACLEQLRVVARQHRLIAVFFADHGVPTEALAPLREAGFAGAMLDTFNKSTGSLRQHVDETDLARFVGAARHLALMTGLAGSLTLADIPALARVGPDVLGFRGALCEAGRGSALSLGRLRRVRAAVDLASRGERLQRGIGA
jgi:(5-formylfuran-3-yl)methyl phosphate synthase